MKLISCLFLLNVLLACSSTNEYILVKNGQIEPEILVPENADKTLQKAATELQTYLEKITSVHLPIATANAVDSNNKVISISVDRSLPGENSVSYRVENNALFISGGNAQSVLYAVYDFLEQQTGVRWYSPTVEKVPQLKTVLIPANLNYIYTPDITTRTVHSKLFYDDHTYADRQKTTYEAFPNYVPGMGVHTFHRLLPEKDFFKDHPEYFALRDGQRRHTQLCLSNPEVLRIAIDSVRAWFERYPDSAVLSVSQDDNTQYCECDKCREIDEKEGSPSGSMIRFVNAVATEFPHKTISTLAYQYTRKPCETRPLDNVLITLCSIECDRSGPIGEKCSDFAQDLMGWKELTDNIRIWDYTTQFTNFLAPFPNIRTLAPNIRFFRDNHARWVFEQHSHNPSELFELRSYLTAKLLWNPDLDEKAITKDFLNGYYEEAGPFVGQYIDRIHAELEKDPDFFLYLYGDPSQAFGSFLKPELLNEYSNIFDEAEKALEGKPEVLDRVRAARISTDYAMLEMARSGISADFPLIENGAVSKDVRERLSRLVASCAYSNVTLMNEMGYPLGQYVADFELTLKRAAQPNLARGKKVTLLTQPKKYANEDPQVLTDGALGGSSFFANWLGFEGNDLGAVVDLGEESTLHSISVGFLQVTNHIVFFPEWVRFSLSGDGKKYQIVATLPTKYPISPESKKNDIEIFETSFDPLKARYLKIEAKNVAKAPFWHNAAGLPVWIFADEVIVN